MATRPQAPPGTAAAADQVERLRALCLALPDASERDSHGGPAWFAGPKGRQFVSLDDHHHGADHLAFWCAAPPGAQAEALASAPHLYFRPPYVGHRGWIGMRIDRDPDWDEVAEVVEDAYRCVAGVRLLARLDERSGEQRDDRHRSGPATGR